MVYGRGTSLAPQCPAWLSPPVCLSLFSRGSNIAPDQSQQAAVVVPDASITTEDPCMSYHRLLAPHASSQAGPSSASIQPLPSP